MAFPRSQAHEGLHAWVQFPELGFRPRKGAALNKVLANLAVMSCDLWICHQEVSDTLSDLRVIDFALAPPLLVNWIFRADFGPHGSGKFHAQCTFGSPLLLQNLMTSLSEQTPRGAGFFGSAFCKTTNSFRYLCEARWAGFFCRCLGSFLHGLQNFQLFMCE